MIRMPFGLEAKVTERTPCSLHEYMAQVAIVAIGVHAGPRGSIAQCVICSESSSSFPYISPPIANQYTPS